MSLDSRTKTFFRLICNGCGRATPERESLCDLLKEAIDFEWLVESHGFECHCPQCVLDRKKKQ